MMNILTKKRGKKGFTLMELLIVVAIIAILVAISIPVFTSQLEKAREATDAANVRAAKACAVTEYLTSETPGANTYFYDAANGKLIDSDTAPSSIKGYGKGTDANAKVDTQYGGQDNSGKVIKVEVDKDGNTKCTWENAGTTTTGN